MVRTITPLSGLWSLASVINILFTCILNCDGQWVYLSRFPSSDSASTPNDFCANGYQYGRVNVSSATNSTPDVPPKTKIIRYKAADTLASTRPLDRKSYHEVVVTTDPRFGCVDRTNDEKPFSTAGSVKDLTGKMIVQPVQVLNMEERRSC